jgi:hypothetical protein
MRIRFLRQIRNFTAADFIRFVWNLKTFSLMQAYRLEMGTKCIGSLKTISILEKNITKGE